MYEINLKSRAMYDKEWAEEHGISVSKIQDENGNLIGSMEEAGGKTVGVQNATVNFMTQKMIVEFEDGQDPKAVMLQVLRACKKVEPDCEIEL